MLTEFCGVIVRALGGSRRYDGPMGKSDRAFAVGALAILTVAAPVVREHWPWIFAALGGLTLLTCRNRIVRGLAELRVEKPA
jgi:phosphatidylglycerophosphate synthase